MSVADVIVPGESEMFKYISAIFFLLFNVALYNRSSNCFLYTHTQQQQVYMIEAVEIPDDIAENIVILY